MDERQPGTSMVVFICESVVSAAAAPVEIRSISASKTIHLEFTSMIIERIDTTADFAALRDEWNALLETSSSRCVFLTHEWLFTWWKHLAAGRTLYILTSRQDGRLVGILPLAVRPAQ